MTVRLALLLPILLMAGEASAAPRRIVSLNPCVDAILMEVAEPSRIAAISHYSRDPRASSIPIETARRFPVTYGTAEEVIALKPDLVIAGRHVALATRHALRRVGIRMLPFDVPETIAANREQVARIAAVVGAPEKGRRLNARIDAALARAADFHGAPQPALIWMGGGLVPGAGTLADELLRHAGFRNMSAAYGLKQWDMLPTEHLLMRPPRVIFTSLGEGGAAAGSREAGARLLTVRALARVAARARLEDYPASLVYCAGPSLARAADRLAEVRRSLEQPR